jgi:hypothetical protein
VSNVNYQIENKDMDGSLKRTIAVSLTNYLDAGAIVAGASGLTLWQKYLGLSEVHLGWLNFISANCLGAALGAIIGGVLADKYGRKFIYCLYGGCIAHPMLRQFPHAAGRFPGHRHFSRHRCTSLVDIHL